MTTRRGPKPLSWRGRLVKPKYGLSAVRLAEGGFSDAYTREEWERRKRARKVAHKSRLRNQRPA